MSATTAAGHGTLRRGAIGLREVADTGLVHLDAEPEPTEAQTS